MHNIHFTNMLMMFLFAFYVYLCQNSTKLLFVTPHNYQEVLRLYYLKCNISYYAIGNDFSHSVCNQYQK